MYNVKTFLTKLALVSCALIVVDFVAGMGLKTLFYKQKSGKYYKITHAIKNAEEDVVIFGSSHAAEHFDAPLMQKLLAKSVFNFGSQGQSLFYIYPLVKSVLSYHKPKLIIVNLDYNELAYLPQSYQFLSILLPYYHVNAVIDSAISLMPFNEDLKCHSFLYRYNSTIGNIILYTYVNRFTSTINNLGYDPVPGNICRYDRTDNTQTSNSINFDPNKINYLLMLINAAQSKNVKLLITTTPIYNYNTNQPNIYKQKLQQLLAKFHINYLDYGTNAGFRGKCLYFSDDTHLNPQGADKWTTACSDYIKTKMF